MQNSKLFCFRLCYYYTKESIVLLAALCFVGEHIVKVNLLSNTLGVFLSCTFCHWVKGWCYTLWNCMQAVVIMKMHVWGVLMNGECSFSEISNFKQLYYFSYSLHQYTCYSQTAFSVHLGNACVYIPRSLWKACLSQQYNLPEEGFKSVEQCRNK